MKGGRVRHGYDLSEEPADPAGGAESQPDLVPAEVPQPADMVRVTGYIGYALAPDVQSLLATNSPPILAHRLVHLRPGTPDAATDELDAAVRGALHQRWSAARWLSRFCALLTTVAVLAVLAVLAACVAGQVMTRLDRVGWLAWPPPVSVARALVAVVLVGWMLAYASILLRGTDELGRCRLACRVAAGRRGGSWAGIALDAPFDRLGRRWRFPGWSFIVLAAGLVAMTWALGQASWQVWLVGAVWAATGIWLIVQARPYRRAQRLATATLFVGAE